MAKTQQEIRRKVFSSDYIGIFLFLRYPKPSITYSVASTKIMYFLTIMEVKSPRPKNYKITFPLWPLALPCKWSPCPCVFCVVFASMP